MKIIKSETASIQEITGVLGGGGLVILPTETLYGAMVDATNPGAVTKLTKYKNRPFGKPYSVAVLNQKMAEKYVHLNSVAKSLYLKFLPGPLTIISKGKHKLAKGVESEDGTLGIRIPDFRLVLNVIKDLNKPITATSANASYKKRPYKVSDVIDNLSNKQIKLIDLIVDAGTLPPNDPSTVIDTTLDDPVVLRQGTIKLSNKTGVVSKSEESTKNTAKEIWQKYEPNQGKRPIVFALQGEMGTGKTVFTKGLARAMQISDLVTSPSFVLEQEYGRGENALYHIDAWRISGNKEFTDLGFEKLIKSKAVVSVEWAERVENVIREFDEEAIIIWVKITYGKRERERFISWGTL